MKHIIFILIVCFSLPGIADQNANRADIYYQDKYIETSNDFAFKFNGFWALPDNKQIIPTEIKYGYGLNGSLSGFLLPRIAVEVGMGMGTYHWDTQAVGDDLYIIPVYALAKLCFAPYGGINPYIGLGGHATYIYASKQNNAISWGTLVEGGIDFIGNDNTIYNIDIKKYLGDTEIKYSDSATVTTIHPLIISIGIGFQF